MLSHERGTPLLGEIVKEPAIAGRPGRSSRPLSGDPFLSLLCLYPATSSPARSPQSPFGPFVRSPACRRRVARAIPSARSSCRVKHCDLRVGPPAGPDNRCGPVGGPWAPDRPIVWCSLRVGPGAHIYVPLAPPPACRPFVRCQGTRSFPPSPLVKPWTVPARGRPRVFPLIQSSVRSLSGDTFGAALNDARKGPGHLPVCSPYPTAGPSGRLVSFAGVTFSFPPLW